MIFILFAFTLSFVPNNRIGLNYGGLEVKDKETVHLNLDSCTITKNQINCECECGSLEVLKTKQETLVTRNNKLILLCTEEEKYLGLDLMKFKNFEYVEENVVYTLSTKKLTKFLDQ